MLVLWLHGIISNVAYDKISLETYVHVRLNCLFQITLTECVCLLIEHRTDKLFTSTSRNDEKLLPGTLNINKNKFNINLFFCIFIL